jgi:hypothetical protein
VRAHPSWFTCGADYCLNVPLPLELLLGNLFLLFPAPKKHTHPLVAKEKKRKKKIDKQSESGAHDIKLTIVLFLVI